MPPSSREVVERNDRSSACECARTAADECVRETGRSILRWQVGKHRKDFGVVGRRLDDLRDNRQRSAADAAGHLPAPGGGEDDARGLKAGAAIATGNP